MDYLGREIREDNPGPILYLYSDGSIERRYSIPK
jgi:hypothetical protein